MGQSLGKAEILGGLLHRIESFEPVNFETEFKDRLILQKTIYLMQSFDLFIGYHFNWYLRGPYSPALTKDAFELINEYKELPTVHFVDKTAEERFNNFMSFTRDHINDEYWLEAMASIHYLYHRSLVKDRDDILKTIRNKMPALKRGDFDDYWDDLCKIGLIGD